jgi:peptidoglycan/LPS O-acetylase OafA/YrhL
MRHPAFPQFHWLDRSQLSEDTAQSLLIALLRGMAALQVALAHLRAEVFPGLGDIAAPPLYYQGLAFATGFAHQAVVAFFVISGWLVGGSLLNKLGQPQALGHYAIDRITRLWTVLLPALLLMVVVGIVTGTVQPAQPGVELSNNYSLPTFVGNLFGLQTVLVQNFGGNYALWSLANETWYYVAFPLVLLALRGAGPRRQAAGLAALAFIAALLPWALTLYFALWLLGALFSRVRIECGNAGRAILVVIECGLLVYYRFTGSNDDLVPASFLQDLNCSLPLLLLLSSLPQKIDPASAPLRRVGKVAKFFSEFSFTLYVIHIPTIILLRHLGRTVFGRDTLAPDRPLDYAIYAGMMVLIVAVAYLSYRLFESQTYHVRRKAKAILLRPQPKPVPAEPALSAE